MNPNDLKSQTGLADLIRNVLGSATSEQVMKLQMIDLARRNLHFPEVLSALVEVLPKVKDTEIQRQLLGLLMNIETSRFENLDKLHEAMLGIFKDEKERAVRAALIDRFSAAVHQDERLALFLVDVLAQPGLSDEESRAVQAAVAKLPVISPETAVTALTRARQAPAAVQALAVAIAEGCPAWGEPMAEALQPYLETRVDRGLRLKIMDHLARAKSLKAAYFPALRSILRTDPDRQMRAAALDLLRYIKDWDGNVTTQLLWTSSQDADEELRTRATELLKESPDLPNEHLEALVRQLHTDSYEGVRVQILGILKPRIGQPSIRTAVLESFTANPAAFDDEELGTILDLLAPYVNRDAAVREALLRSTSLLLRATQRKQLLEIVLPKLRSEESVPWLVELFAKEHEESLRTTLFGRLRPLSVAKHPELVKIFCQELTEPGSAFRQACAEALASSAELYPEIPPALEDVLMNDQDIPLVRACLDGYLKPRVARRFEVLLAVIGNEQLDTVSRQACMDQVIKEGMSADQSKQLSDVLASLKSQTLTRPA